MGTGLEATLRVRAPLGGRWPKVYQLCVRSGWWGRLQPGWLAGRSGDRFGLGWHSVDWVGPGSGGSPTVLEDGAPGEVEVRRRTHPGFSLGWPVVGVPATFIH